MSGGVKSGLLFALIGLVSVIAVSFIPLGALLCAPVVAALAGGLAGYFGVRWSQGPAGVGTGALAGTFAGIGTLIGAVGFFLISSAMINAMEPEALDQMVQQMQQAFELQPGTEELSPDELQAMMNLMFPIAGFCVGLIYLLIALALGALGGWIAGRNRDVTASPMEPPPLQPMQ